MIKSVINFFRDRDEMADPGFTYFHYDSDKNSRTVIGGIGSAAVTCMVTYIGIKQGLEMFAHSNPQLSTHVGNMDTEDKNMTKIGDVTTHWLEIMSGGYKKPWETVELDETSKKYMRVRLNNVINKYENGDKKEYNKYYELERCTEDNFKTPFEKQYFNSRKDDFLYCVQSDEPYLKADKTES